MNKKIVLIIILMILIVSGCTKEKVNKEKTPEELDIIVQEGTITIECRKVTQDDETVKKAAIETAHYDKKQKMINRKVKTIEEYKTEEAYKKALYNYSLVVHKDSDSMRYLSKQYDDIKTFVWIKAELKEVKTHISSAMPKTPSYYLLDHENKNYKCEMTGASRKEIGLSD